MATQQDLQDLLRLLTSRKVPMLQAMNQVKAFQAVGLRSISQIAEAPASTVEAALKDSKAAKSLQSACKSQVKKQQSSSPAPAPRDQKRPAQEAPDAGTSGGKRIRTTDPFQGDLSTGPAPLSPRELEASLELPLCLDEERMARTALQTNRAPLVLAFAVELLRHTMPEQPLSSRLSLAQAVVSANSRSKAVSLGLERGPSAEAEGWGEGQPRVRVMGREVAVLKRSGYEWRGEEEIGEASRHEEQEAEEAAEGPHGADAGQGDGGRGHGTYAASAGWSVSQPISLKSSTFVARAVHITDPSQRPGLIRSLIEANPTLKTATHNAWAYRVRPLGSSDRIREESFDDGETGCGDFMLRLLRESGSIDTLVVQTRWFGGILLGPDRWRLMRNCVTGALAERLRKTGTQVALGGEAVWGLDLEGMKGKSSAGGHGSGWRQHETTGVVGMVIHRPEAARSYILKSFHTASSEQHLGEPGREDDDGKGGETSTSKAAKRSPRKSQKAIDLEKEENLGLLLGALRLLFNSWADHLTVAELDNKAWRWYCDVRPAVDVGPSGWGAKGLLKLSDILDLRRREVQVQQ